MIEATITTPQPHPQELETERERLQPTELTLNYKDDSGNVISSEATPLFVVGTPPSSGHGQEHKYHGVLTNDPSLFLAVYEEGPTGLDREEFADGAELFVVRGSAETIAISSVYEQLAYSYGLSVSADRMITMHFGGLHRADVAPTAANLDNSLVSADIDYGNDNNLHKIAENGDLFSSFRHGYGYREVPAIRDFYHSLGMNDPEVDDVGQVTSLQMPTPGELMSKFRTLEADPANVIDVPPVKYLREGAISVAEYVDTIAEGYFPVGVSNFYYYMHDISAEHFASLLLHGKPLMDFMSRYARAVQSQDTIHFSEFLEDGQFGDLSDDKKMSAASQRLDNVTSVLADISVNLPNEERRMGTHGGDLVNDFVVALRQNGELDDSLIAKSLIERGIVESADEITGTHVIDELAELARERFGITPKPTEKPKSLAIPGI